MTVCIISLQRGVEAFVNGRSEFMARTMKLIVDIGVLAALRVV